MMRRVTFGLLASGGFLFCAAAAGIGGTGLLVSGALLLVAASVLMAVSLESPSAAAWTSPQIRRSVEIVQVDPAA